MKGGQTVDVAAPIDTIPLFVRAGSIIPLGSEILSTDELQTIAQVHVYPGADGEFTLYNDDGQTYAYEKGNPKSHTCIGMTRPDNSRTKALRLGPDPMQALSKSLGAKQSPLRCARHSGSLKSAA